MTAIYNSSGSKVGEYAYDAWGNCTVLSGAATDVVRYNPIRYRGYYYDIETGLYYLNARYYNPQWRRFISPAKIEALTANAANGLNSYIYANNNPICIAYCYSSVGGSTSGVSFNSFASERVIDSEIYLSSPYDLSIKFPSQNWLSLGVDLTASMSGALSVLGWTLKNPEFYEFWYSAYGISKYEMLSNLKSPLTKTASVISYALVAYDTYTDVIGHINSGDSWQTTTASGMVTTGLGTFNVWASAKVGSAVGTYIGGAPGFLIGIASGVVIGIVINGVFYTEINGKSISGQIEDGIEWFLEWIS